MNIPKLVRVVELQDKLCHYLQGRNYKEWFSTDLNFRLRFEPSSSSRYSTLYIHKIGSCGIWSSYSLYIRSAHSRNFSSNGNISTNMVCANPRNENNIIKIYAEEDNSTSEVHIPQEFKDPEITESYLFQSSCTEHALQTERMYLVYLMSLVLEYGEISAFDEFFNSTDEELDIIISLMENEIGNTKVFDSRK